MKKKVVIAVIALLVIVAIIIGFHLHNVAVDRRLDELFGDVSLSDEEINQLASELVLE